MLISVLYFPQNVHTVWNYVKTVKKRALMSKSRWRKKKLKERKTFFHSTQMRSISPQLIIGWSFRLFFTVCSYMRWSKFLVVDIFYFFTLFFAVDFEFWLNIFHFSFFSPFVVSSQSDFCTVSSTSHFTALELACHSSFFTPFSTTIFHSTFILCSAKNKN